MVTPLILAVSLLELADVANRVLYLGIAVISSLTLIIHANYYLEDRNKTVTILKDKIIISKRGKIFTYPLESLVKVTVVGSKNIEDFGIPQIPSEPYYYAELEFSDGVRLYITCLLFGDYSNVQKALPRKYIWRKYDMFSFLPLIKPQIVI